MQLTSRGQLSARSRLHPLLSVSLVLSLTAGGSVLLPAGCDHKGSPSGGAPQGPSGKPAAAPYELTVQAPATVAVGEQTHAVVKVTPHKPYKMNLEYPVKLQLSPPAGATVPEKVLRGKQARRFTHAELLLEPAFTVTAAGEHTFTGELRFSVCTEQVCEMKSEHVRWVARGEQK